MRDFLENVITKKFHSVYNKTFKKKKVYTYIYIQCNIVFCISILLRRKLKLRMQAKVSQWSRLGKGYLMVQSSQRGEGGEIQMYKHVHKGNLQLELTKVIVEVSAKHQMEINVLNKGGIFLKLISNMMILLIYFKS